MSNISIDKINEIRNSVDIVDVISRYLNVVKKGKNYFAICPFHNDTNPSLSISREKQIYKCFVCGEGGNVITFIQKYKKIPYIDALKEIALIGGVTLNIQENVKREIIDPKIQVLYDLLEDATKYYQTALSSSQSAINYVTQRELHSDILHEFRIGYSLDDEKMIKYLKSKKYSEEDMIRSGLVIETENGTLKDRFANRLIFPIQDIQGRVVAFSGRVIEKSTLAKYLNSPETEIFIKGNTLYHYHSALNSIKKSKKVYICEGFMDVIALFKANISNAIALMGTAFTKEHLKILKFLGVNVVLSLDSDNAGRLATKKLATELEKENINVQIVSDYDEVKDADEYYNRYGMNQLLLKVQNPITFFEFNVNEMKKSSLLQDNLEERKKFAHNMCRYLAKKDDLEIDFYLNKMVEDLKFPKTTLLKLVKKEKEKQNSNYIPTNFTMNQRLLKRNEKIKSDVVFQMIQSSEAIEEFQKEEVYFSMQDDCYKTLIMYILDYYLENKNFTEADLYSYISNINPNDDEIIKTLTEVLNTHEMAPIYTKEYFKDLIYEIKEIMTLEQKIDFLKEKLEYIADPKEKGNITNEIILLNQQLKQKKFKTKE